MREGESQPYLTGPALATFIIGCLLAGLAGCPFPGECTDPLEDGNVGLDPDLFPNSRVVGEPNDSFTDPIDIILDNDGRARLAGVIATSDDIDIYSLGAMSAGDRIIIEVTTPCSDLDPMLAVFDEQGRLAFENDDRDYDLLQYDCFINQVIRRDSSPYFLAVAGSPFAARHMGKGSYEVSVMTVRDGQPPAPAGQVLVLDFDGGTVSMPWGDTYTVGVFDTADISPAYAGMTAEVRDQIAATIRENYEGLDLDVRSYPGDFLPVNRKYSTVFFGGYDATAFALAQAIDPYNADPYDDAIVFTDTFTPAQFGRVLTAEELGTAIGNVVTHEVGHLLGLNHVANIDDVMDTTGAADTLLLDQEFMESPLDESIFPIGTQDGLLWLLETLGSLP